MPELFDVVELIVDLPEQGLYAGMEGTIIEIHAAGEAYEVEFIDEQGEPLTFLALRPEQFVVVWQASTQQRVPLAERVVLFLPTPPVCFANFVIALAERPQKFQKQTATFIFG